MTDLVIIAGARTPFGAFGGGLANQTATDLAVAASKAAINRSKIDPAQIDQVVMGNVIQTSKDAIYLGRHVALRSGLKEETPGLILNLLCGSGVQAIVTAGMLIEAGQAKVVLAGGTDSLSMTPYLNWGMRWGARMGHQQIWDGLDIRDTLPDASMGETAENLETKYKISRQEQDEYAYLSQMRTKVAVAAGHLSEEIEPVAVLDKKGVRKVVNQDEHPRPDTTIEALSTLKPVFKRDGTVTAGNSCGIVDGAAAVIVTTLNHAEKLGLSPLSRVVSWSLTGVPPHIMGIGPVHAIPIALEKADLKQEQIDLVEINEAFAVQYIACERELRLEREKVNVNGGAIALGHPFAASGARLALSLSFELRRRKARYGVVSLCIGGGMGIAVVLERL